MTEDDTVGWHHWLDGHPSSLSKFWELVMDREAWHAAVHGVSKSWTWLSDWTETYFLVRICSLGCLVFCVAFEVFLTLTTLAGESESFLLQIHWTPSLLSVFWTFSLINLCLCLSVSMLGTNLRMTSLLMSRLNKTEFSSLRQLPSSWWVQFFDGVVKLNTSEGDGA